MTGATLLVMLKVLITVLVLLQLSFAVKVTLIAPQNEVICEGGGALSVFVITPQPASVAVKLERLRFYPVSLRCRAERAGSRKPT